MNDPTQIVDVERSLITAALLSKAAFLKVTAMIGPDDFFKPAHQHLWEAIEQCAPATNDPVLVAARLAANGWDGDEYTLNGLNRFYCDPNIPATCTSHAHLYAKSIVEERTRRQLIHALADGVQQAQTIDVLAARDELVDKLERLSTVNEHVESVDVEEFLANVNYEHNWLIEGFLERGDRMVITAGEGVGKSVLLTQFAFMAAAGLHPWTQKPVPPVRVLLVDLENSEGLIGRRLAMMRAAVRHAEAHRELPEAWDRSRLKIEHRTAGINLMDPADRDWLGSLCLANRTELLVIGPAYRMYRGAAARGDTGGEDQIRQVTAAIDDLRSHCGITVIMETHAPHGMAGARDLRPFGSSVWMRWPEFGISIGTPRDETPKDYPLGHWRPPRDERPWPTALLRSTPWPWVANMG